MSPAGKIEATISVVHSHELCLDAADNFYGEHVWCEGDRTGQWGHYVWKRSPNGSVEKVIPPTKGFPVNYSVVRDKHGNMFWPERWPAGDGTPGTRAYESANRIRRRSATGIETIAEPRFRNVRWMAA